MKADPMLLDAVTDLLTDLCTAEDVRASELSESLPQRLLTSLVGAGLHQVGIQETVGGVGGTIADAAGILRVAGRFACPLPLAEQAITGGWLLGRAQLSAPRELFTTAVATDLAMSNGTISGSGTRVPWLSEVDEVVGLTRDGIVVRLRVSDLAVARGLNLAGERRDSFTVSAAPVVDAAPAPAGAREELLARAAASRVLLLAGACESVLRLVVRYAGEREQFGKRINTFQAVAAHLARIAEETALVVAAADLVTMALESPHAAEEAAIAKTVSGGAASVIARLAHQVHGAMGVTAECDLQLFTRRIWSWRDEHGAEAFWGRAVGERLVAAGADKAWDLVAGPVGGGS